MIPVPKTKSSETPVRVHQGLATQEHAVGAPLRPSVPKTNPKTDPETESRGTASIVQAAGTPLPLPGRKSVPESSAIATRERKGEAPPRLFVTRILQEVATHSCSTGPYRRDPCKAQVSFFDRQIGFTRPITYLEVTATQRHPTTRVRQVRDRHHLKAETKPRQTPSPTRATPRHRRPRRINRKRETRTISLPTVTHSHTEWAGQERSYAGCSSAS